MRQKFDTRCSCRRLNADKMATSVSVANPLHIRAIGAISTQRLKVAAPYRGASFQAQWTECNAAHN